MIQANSIYDRFKKLGYEAQPQAMSEVGFIVRDLYKETFNNKPPKEWRTINSLKQLVNVYPEKFLAQVDLCIKNYHLKDIEGKIEEIILSKTQTIEEQQSQKPTTEKRERKRIMVKKVEPMVKKANR